MRHALAAIAVAAALAASDAAAHEGHKPSTRPAAPSTERHPWGQEGDPRKATRTVSIDMSDAMRFTPDRLRVKQGETVRFVVRNRGQVMHEMVIGTAEELRRHAELMKKHPGMEHDEPYMAHVSPGKEGQIAWTFTQAGTFMYGCLIPGHWESGMKGTIVVEPR